VTASSIPAADGQQEAVGPYVEDTDLAGGLTRLRRRTAVVPTERWLAVAGGVLMPLGVVLVIAGWFGASHTTRLFEEIPYLISGGLLGIVLTTVGAALYFGYWLTRLVTGQRQMLEALTAMQERLAMGEPGADAPGPALNGASLVATASGTMFHRPDCQVVAGRPASELRSVRLPAPDMAPCRLCAPLG
jgi:hypothetical protein